MKPRVALLALVAAVVVAGVVAFVASRPGDVGDASSPPDEAATGEPPRLVGRVPDSPSRDGIRITGVVVDETGEPVTGVEVVALSDPKPDPRRHRVPERLKAAWVAPPAPAAPLARTATNGDGTFRLDVPEGVTRCLLRARPAAPRIGATRRIRLPVDASLPVRLRTWAGRTLAVRVVDGHDAPVAAWVRCARASGLPLAAAHWTVGPRRAGADGRLRLTVPSYAVRVSAHVPGHAAHGGRVVEPPFPDEVVLRLGRPDGAIVEGRVRTSSDAPIAGARVALSVTTEGDETVFHYARTDAEGAYRFVALPAGRIASLDVYAASYAQPTGRVPRMTLVAGDRRRIDLVLSAGCVLEGRVVDADGQGVARAVVEAYGDAFRTSATAGTDGTFRLDELTTGAYLVCVARAGYRIRLDRRSPGAGDLDVSHVVFVREGERRELLVSLRRGVDLRGRVVTPDGRGAAGATVALTRDHRWSSEVSRAEPPTATADADGRFAYSDLVVSDGWSVRAWTGDLVSEETTIEMPDAVDAVEVELRLRPAASIEGVIVDRAGRPFAQAALDDDAWGVAACIGNRYHTGPADGGRWKVIGLRPGTYSVRPTRPSAAAKRADAVEVTVAWGEQRTGVVLRLGPAIGVSGTVVDLDGRPVPDLGLRLEHGGSGEQAWCRTGADGTFRMAPIRAGLYEVYCTDDLEVLLGRVRTGDGEARLLYRSRGVQRVLTGRVLDPDGRPVPSASIDVWEAPHGSLLGWGEVRDGSFRVTYRSVAGGVLVDVSGPRDEAGRFLEVRSPSSSHPLTPGSDSILVRLDRGLSLAGRVVDETGTGVPGIPLEVGYGNLSRLVTDAEGRFRRLALDPGTVWVNVKPPPPWVDAATLKAEAGRQDVVVRLRKGGVLRGRVVDPDGAPVGGARLVATWGRRAAVGFSGIDGAFRLGPLRTGEVTLDVTPRRSSRDRRLLSLKGLKVTVGSDEIVVRLEEGAFLEGVVLGPDGQPVGYARVEARPDPLAGSSTASGSAVARKDTGTFRIGPIAPGPYLVSAYGNVPGRSQSEAVRVVVPASDLVIVLPARPAIRGRLVGEDLKGFRVALTGPHGPRSRRRDRSVRKGAFVFDRVVADGVYVLHAYRLLDDRYALLRDVRPRDEEHVLELQEGLRIKGRIDTSALDLRPLPTPHTRFESDVFPATALGDAGVKAEAPLELDGTFVFRGLPPGAYTVKVAQRVMLADGRSVVARGTAKNLHAGARDVVIPVTASR